MIIWIGCPFDELLAWVVLTDCSFECLLASPVLFFYVGKHFSLCVWEHTSKITQEGNGNIWFSYTNSYVIDNFSGTFSAQSQVDLYIDLGWLGARVGELDSSPINSLFSLQSQYFHWQHFSQDYKVVATYMGTQEKNNKGRQKPVQNILKIELQSIKNVYLWYLFL